MSKIGDILVIFRFFFCTWDRNGRILPTLTIGNRRKRSYKFSAWMGLPIIRDFKLRRGRIGLKKRLKRYLLAIIPDLNILCDGLSG
jgi:hypothetical protein